MTVIVIPNSDLVTISLNSIRALEVLFCMTHSTTVATVVEYETNNGHAVKLYILNLSKDRFISFK